jgi:hypothetical protein
MIHLTPYEKAFWEKNTHHSHESCDVSLPCPIHRPTPHHMRQWPMVLRASRNRLIERTCEHGIGHPDPDSAPWVMKMFADTGIHGCDGCCTPAFLSPGNEVHHET